MRSWRTPSPEGCCSPPRSQSSQSSERDENRSRILDAPGGGSRIQHLADDLISTRVVLSGCSPPLCHHQGGQRPPGPKEPGPVPVGARENVIDVDPLRRHAQGRQRLALGRAVVTISSNVLFDCGSTGLAPVATGKLKELAGRIAGTTQTVAVVGYTDSVGEDASNAALSNKRAEAAGGVLRSALPAGTQITTEARGLKEPVAPNSTGGKDVPEGRAKNRRVAVSFTPRGP